MVLVFGVEAICITQPDIDETNEQVARMGDGYRDANVLAWIEK